MSENMNPSTAEKNGPLMVLKVLLWTAAAFHLLVGGGLNCVPGAAPFMANVYGAELNWSPEFTYILKPLGAFMFALGVMCAFAALNPLRYRVIVYGFAILFFIRALQRLVFSDEIADVFGINIGRNIINASFFILLGLVLIVLERIASNRTGSDVTSPRAVK